MNSSIETFRINPNIIEILIMVFGISLLMLFFCYIDNNLTIDNIIYFVKFACVTTFFFIGFTGRWIIVKNGSLIISKPLILIFLKPKIIKLELINEIKIYSKGAYLQFPGFEIFYLDTEQKQIRYRFIYSMLAKKDIEHFSYYMNSRKIKTKIYN
ncbi:MAG: hypothetical protein IPP71_01830 [Bacteroidetes bacterium]|nr:hypothetical protein [Bacteroidota bacterium]